MDYYNAITCPFQSCVNAVLCTGIIVLCCYLDTIVKARCFIKRLQSIVVIADLVFTNMFNVMIFF